MGGTGEGVQVEGGAGVRGAAPAGVRGAEPPDCHETNLTYSINKFYHEIKMFHKQIFSRNPAFNSCMIEFSIPDYNKKIIENIFKYWTS